MKITFSNSNKKRLHKRYRDSIKNVVFILNKFKPAIIYNPAYPYVDIILHNRHPKTPQQIEDAVRRKK